MPLTKAKIISTGYYLPSKVLTNKDLEDIVDTTDEWIITRTGIKERRIASSDEASSDMGVKAGFMALERASIDPGEIDAVICSTITPDHSFPSTACLIQDKLGLKNAFAFDVSAACSGFIYALSIAESLLLSGKINSAMVIASEKMSAITDWKDRSTCVLFGDGAGCAILKRTESDSGILSSYMGSDGAYGDLLITPAGGSRNPVTVENVQNGEQYLQMKGDEVFKIAVKKMSESAIESLKRAGLTKEDVKMLIPHQANLRIIKAVQKRLKLEDDQIFIIVDKIGNVSAATVALAMAEAEEKNLLKEGDILNLVSFGAGFTWAGMVIRW